VTCKNVQIPAVQTESLDISLPRYKTALAITVIASALLSEILAHGGAAKIRYPNRKNIDQPVTILEIDPYDL
jgi:hypothetical protein